MKFNYSLPFLSSPPNPEFACGSGVAALARAAEDAGFTSIALSDHPAPSDSWRRGVGHDALDPLVALAFAAATTTRLRVLTYVVVVPYRHPLVLAKSVATLDVLAGGRLDLGLGVGYMRREFAAIDAPFNGRGRWVDEALELMKLAWTGEPIEHDGEHFTVHGVTAQPVPVQLPHPPLWFGGNSRASLRRIAGVGTGWLAMPAPRVWAEGLKSRPLEDAADLSELLADLTEECTAVGRTGPVAVMWQVPHGEEQASVDELAESLEPLAAAGVTHVSLNGSGSTLAAALAEIERFGEVVRRLATL